MKPTPSTAMPATSKQRETRSMISLKLTTRLPVSAEPVPAYRL
jgi:hypothetical protein